MIYQTKNELPIYQIQFKKRFKNVESLWIETLQQIAFERHFTITSPVFSFDTEPILHLNKQTIFLELSLNFTLTKTNFLIGIKTDTGMRNFLTLKYGMTLLKKIISKKQLMYFSE